MTISRRDFNRTILASLVGAGITGPGRVHGATATSHERDRFGGWKGRTFKATGYGPVADNLAQRAQWTDEFFRRAFARPDFVGWHYCGLIDASQRVPRKQDRQHSGLLDGFGNPYPEIQQALKAASAELYEIATRKR